MAEHQYRSRKAEITCLWIYGTALIYFVLKQVCCLAFLEGFADQGSHLSYILNMVKSPSLLPDFRSMTLFKEVGTRDGLTLYTTYSGTLGNMTHPPLYYLLMAFFGNIQPMPDGLFAVDVFRLRVMNAAISASSVGMAFYLGHSRLKSRPPLVHAAYAAAIVTLPLLAYLGSSINNDNLALLAMVIFFAGLLRYEDNCLDWRTYTLISCGFLVGAMSKLTTALMFLLMLGAVLILDLIRTKSFRLIMNRAFLIVLSSILVFLAYEIWVRRTYGSWQPSLYHLDPEYFYQTEFYTPPEARAPLTLLQYVKIFLKGMGHTWSSFYGETPALNEKMHNGFFGVVYWIPVAMTVFAATWDLIKNTGDRLALPVTVGFLGAMAYHFYSNWSGYPVSGYLGGCQARYYMAMIVPLAYVMCSRMTLLVHRRETATRVLAVLLMISWVAGDGVRLLIHVAIPALVG